MGCGSPAGFSAVAHAGGDCGLSGPDRLQKLIDGARKEGSLALYTSRVAEDTTPVIEAFTKRYGVEVQAWRGSNRAVLQRVVQERRAGRCAADVISSGTPALEPLHREQLLQAVRSPTLAELMLDHGGKWSELWHKTVIRPQ
jgi:iron(III) transport system substrate-binding protein